MKVLDLEKDSLGSLFVKLSVPTVLAQFSNLLYNLVARIFLGRMPGGDTAQAALGITLPVTMIVSALSVLIANGGAPISSIALGENNQDKAERILGVSTAMILAISVLLTISVLVFLKPLLYAFGASEVTFEYAGDYLKIYILGALFTQLTLVLNAFINSQGFTKISMISIFIATFVNVFLNALFIFVFDMGVEGSAYASVFAQFFSMCWSVRFLLSDKAKVKIKFNNLKFDKAIAMSVLGLGSAPFIIQISESAIIAVLNTQLLKFGGDAAIAAMTIVFGILQMISLPLGGLAQGVQPILSYNYGAGNHNRVKKTITMLFSICGFYELFFTLLVLLFPQRIIALFNSNAQMMEITVFSARAYLTGNLIIGVQIACQQAFIALGKAKQAVIIAVFRKVVLIIPLLLILPYILSNKHFAVLIGTPVADVLSTVLSIAMFVKFYKKLCIS